MATKLQRRLALLDDLIDLALRSPCQFSMCNGFEAPIRHMQTCSRCASIHRAMQMGLVKKVQQTYIRTGPQGDICVGQGTLEQFSSLDGKLVP